MPSAWDAQNDRARGVTEVTSDMQKNPINGDGGRWIRLIKAGLRGRKYIAQSYCTITEVLPLSEIQRVLFTPTHLFGTSFY